MRALLCVAASLQAFAQNPFNLNINGNGAYSLSVPSFANFALSSGDTFLQSAGHVYSSGAGDLALSNQVTFGGNDAWGPFNATALDWSISGTHMLTTTFKVYQNVPAVSFEQTFPPGISNTSADYASRNGVISSFPSFLLPSTTNLGFMQYVGPFIDNSVSGPAFGRFAATPTPDPNIVSGLAAGSGPIVFFDQSTDNAVVLSASSSFMSASSALTTTAGGKSALSYGLMGSATSVPAWHSVEFVAWYGAQGVNTAMQAWGAALLAKYNKAHGLSRLDYTNTHLGYNTDHGAYYYYNVAGMADYSAVLSAVWNYSQAVGIPYRHVLLDSWWYFKGVGDGVKNWTAMPSIFQGGNAGIAALVQQTGWKVIAHNRYWSTNTDYASQNGGQYQFYVDQSKSPAGGQMAMPLEQRFWQDLLTSSVKEWGLTTYEQDWLYNELNGVDLLTADVTAGRQWLMNMGQGAEFAGVSIQYCMPYPRHILQSVEIPAVTQTRASDDHVPGGNELKQQWRMGFSSIFSWAVGVAPFKDNYWSTSSQPGGSCGNAVEVSPGLHNAISVFSAGPVTPGDGVGFSDVPQIMRACNAAGRLLQPSRSMTAINSEVRGRAFQSAPGTTYGEVYGTYSLVDGWAWDHVLAGDLSAPYAVTRADLESIRSDIPLRAVGGVGTASLAALAATAVPATPGTEARIAYTLNTSTLALSTLTVQSFNPGSTIPLPACGETDFQVWHTAPVWTVGGSSTWALLGELSKWVPVSEARVESITIGEDIAVVIQGQVGEVVPVTFYNVGASNVTTVTCTLGASGTARVVMPWARCD